MAVSVVSVETALAAPLLMATVRLSDRPVLSFSTSLSVVVLPTTVVEMALARLFSVSTKAPETR